MCKKLTLLILLLGLFACKTKQEEYLYDAIGEFGSGYAPVFRDNFTGIIDSLGNVVVPCEYASVKKIWEAKGLCTAVKINNKNEEITEIFNFKTGKKILSAKGDNLSFYDNGWIVVRDDYDMVYDYEGKVIIPEKYTDISELNEYGYARVTIFDRENGVYYYGYIDKDGNEKIPAVYTELPSRIEPIPYLLKVQKNRLYGYIDIDNEEHIPIKYDDIADMSLEHFSGWCQKDGKYGYINEGKEVIPPLYEEKLYNEYYRVVAKNSQGKYAIFYEDGKQLTDFKWDEIVYQVYTVDVARKDGKYFLHEYNANKKEIEYTFDEAVAFHEDWIIAKKNGKWGMVSLLEEKTLIPYEYDTFEEDSEFIFTKNGKKYAIDFVNNYAVKPFTNDSKKAKHKNKAFAAYDDWQKLDDKHFVVTKDNKKGVINAQGKTTVPIVFENIYDRDKDNTVLVTNNNDALEGIYNYVTGKELLPCKYYRILDKKNIPYLIVGEIKEKKNGKEKYSVDFYSKKYEPVSIGVYDSADYRFFHIYLIVSKGSSLGIMDKNGKEIIPCKYRVVEYDYNLKAFKIINHSGRHGLYDTNGKMLLPEEYDIIGHQAGNAILRKDGKAGLFSLTKGIVVPCEYKWVDQFYSNILAKHENGSLTWFDDDGKQILQFENADIHNFTNNSVIIRDNQTKKTLFMNKEGKMLFEKDYTHLSKNISDEGLMAVQKNQKWGFINMQGEEVIPCFYDEARRFWNGIGKVKTKGKWMFINNKGEILPNITAKEENNKNFW